jgi:hypothetical protein
MKLKTIILMLLAATIFAVGFQACKQANLKPEGLQMNSNPQETQISMLYSNKIIYISQLYKISKTQLSN